jgi:hypothetical protein
MKKLPNPKICLLLDKIININPTPTNYQNYDKQTFLDSMPNLSVDSPHGTNSNFLGINNESNVYLAAAAKLLGAKLITNSVIYPAKGLMGWHTNSDVEGTRVYYTKTDGEAIFSYVKDGVRYNDYDNIGVWTCRHFVISKDKPLWHAIWTEKQRYAFGFML